MSHVIQNIETIEKPNNTSNLDTNPTTSACVEADKLGNSQNTASLSSKETHITEQNARSKSDQKQADTTCFHSKETQEPSKIPLPSTSTRTSTATSTTTNLTKIIGDGYFSRDTGVSLELELPESQQDKVGADNKNGNEFSEHYRRKKLQPRKRHHYRWIVTTIGYFLVSSVVINGMFFTSAWFITEGQDPEKQKVLGIPPFFNS